MGSSSTNATKRRSRSSESGRSIGNERPAKGSSDATRGMAAPNQKAGSRRRAPQGRSSG